MDYPRIVIISNGKHTVAFLNGYANGVADMAEAQAEQEDKKVRRQNE